jgi:hypothetical protein
MSKKVSKDIESTYKTYVTFNCPTRGKITQEVVVKRFKAEDIPEEKPVDASIKELLGSDQAQELDEAGFHEDMKR